MSRISILLSALKRHYQAPLSEAFAQFKLGAMVFFLGLVLVYMAQQLIEPSIKQDAFTLAGLVLAAVGFILAMAAHVRMIISRLWHLFKPLELPTHTSREREPPKSQP